MRQKITQRSLDPLPELVALGLTRAESVCYQFLIKEGAATPNDLAKKLGFLPNAVYRLMDGLMKKGFVVKLDTKPATYQPVPPEIALGAFSKQKTREFEEQTMRALQLLEFKKTPYPTRVDVLTGRNAMFSAYIALAKEAKSEILIISIGEGVNDETKLVNRDALERGVSIKLIAHRYDKSNEQLLKNWVKMGIEVRHVPDWGFHLVIVDSTKSILAINNPKRTEERVSLLIENKGLSNALRTYFFTMWKKAQVIK